MKVEKVAANVKRWNLSCVECHMYDSTKAVSSKSGIKSRLEGFLSVFHINQDSCHRL